MIGLHSAAGATADIVQSNRFWQMKPIAFILFGALEFHSILTGAGLLAHPPVQSATDD